MLVTCLTNIRELSKLTCEKTYIVLAVRKRSVNKSMVFIKVVYIGFLLDVFCVGIL